MKQTETVRGKTLKLYSAEPVHPVQMRNNIQRWLAPSNVQDDLHRHQLEYMRGSCDWILNGLQTQNGPNSTLPGSLRIQGRPGAGKTVLAAYLVNHLGEQRKENVLYFFCKAGDPEKRESVQVLRTLLSQLLHIDHSLYAEVEPLYTRSGRSVADSYVDVCAAILLTFTKSSLLQIAVIIDALDECHEVGHLVQVLFDVGRVADGKFNFIFTSRQIQLPFSFDKTITLDAHSADKQVRKYIDHRVSRIETISGSDLGKMVVREISSAADGLWLYARLMLDDIQRFPSKALIQRHLRNIPHGLSQLYTQVLRSKERMFSPVHLKFAQQVFLWLDVDDYMPSFLPAECLPYDTMCLLFQRFNFGEPLFDPAALVSELCSPMIEICDAYGNTYDDGRIGSVHDYEINFIHHTADQYIRECKDLSAVDLPLTLKPRRLRQLHRGSAAVWYFTVCNTSELNLKVLRDVPYATIYKSYFEMAYGLWGALWLQCLPADLDGPETVEATILLREINDFISPQSDLCLRWVESAIIINYAGKWSQLLENAEEGLVLANTLGGIIAIPIFEIYRQRRMTFFKDYVYVLELTGPNY